MKLQDTKLQDTKEDTDDNDFSKADHFRCDPIHIFNSLQFLDDEALHIDIRPAKTYDTHHIRFFINIPVDSPQEYVLKHAEQAISSLPKELVIHVYCISSEEQMKQQTDKVWYESLHQLMSASLGQQYTLQSFNVSKLSYSEFAQRLPFLKTRQVPPKRDGATWTVYPSMIMEQPALYLGDADHAESKRVMEDLGITHVVNVTASVKCMFEGSGIKYLQCKIADDWFESIDQHFAECIAFMKAAFEQDAKHRVLVHCQAGVSRSSTIIIAYLMQMHKMPYAQAVEFVTAQRKIAQPNGGFQRQLQSWEERGCKALELEQ